VEGIKRKKKRRRKGEGWRKKMESNESEIKEAKTT
jgi:hypothetical protein